MFRDISAVRKYCFVDEAEASELTSWRRPILILKQKEELSAGVSNGLNTTGAMLALYAISLYAVQNACDTGCYSYKW